MKIFSLLVILITLMPQAFAQKIEAEIGGKLYSCEPIGGTGPAGIIDCVETAFKGPFNRDEAKRLCEGAKNANPAICANKAFTGPYNKEESMSLCMKAISSGPADCAIKAFAGPFSKLESMTLCKFPEATVGVAECAIRAFEGPYTREEALRLCAHKPDLGGVVPVEMSKDEFERIVIIANEKAVFEGVYKK